MVDVGSPVGRRRTGCGIKKADGKVATVRVPHVPEFVSRERLRMNSLPARRFVCARSVNPAGIERTR